MSRTDRVREILDLAMERPSAERPAFVSGAAGNDPKLKSEVMSLLAALEHAGDLLEPPAVANGEAAPAEPLTGLSFGAYVIGERIGEGGMGVVYATKDTRLGRTVAVKALPPALARDPHRRARFEQEARLLASLNHPNIAAIYGVEDTPRGPVMILEFVPGKTLSQEIKEHRLTTDEAIAIARQIARGLEAAHAAGIVHRDLKPANIKRTPEGVVKILDLGIARSPSSQDAAVTAAGLVVGTASYMSPEQARGKPVDRRADMWAFGCVLFEMLTGKRAFDGDTASDAAAAVLRGEPEWSLLPVDVPLNVRRLLKRTIEKNPEQRLRDAGDALLELEADEPAASQPASTKWPIAAGIVVAIAGGVGVSRWRNRDDPMPQPIRFSIATPQLSMPSVSGCAAISPDGKQIVYAALDANRKSHLYLRDLNSFEAVLLEGTEDGNGPFFSPDGNWLGFSIVRAPENSRLLKVSLKGGPPQVLVKDVCYSATWGDDDVITYSTEKGLLKRVSASGGEPATVTIPGDETPIRSQSEILPGSKHLLCSAWRQEGDKWVPRIEAVEVSTGNHRVLVDGASQAKFVSSLNLLLYHRAGSLFAAPINASEPAVVGEAVQIVPSLSAHKGGELQQYSVSRDGKVVMVPGNTVPFLTDIAWFEASGGLRTVYQGNVYLETLRLSPDEKRIAFTSREPRKELWVLDTERGSTTLLQKEGFSKYPVWTPDGSRIVFEWQERDENGPSSLAVMRSDGGGVKEILYTHSGQGCFPTGFSADGSVILVSATTGHGEDTDIFTFDMNSGGALKPVFPTREDRVAARFSPDGKMLAYSSTESGRPEVYVVQYPGLRQKIMVSTSGGERPTWKGDSSRLFFRNQEKLFAVSVTQGESMSIGIPEPVIDWLPAARYDTASSGNAFLLMRPRGEFLPQMKIDVIVGGLQNLKKP